MIHTPLRRAASRVAPLFRLILPGLVLLGLVLLGGCAAGSRPP
jgi:hypothetical protein